VSLLRWAAVGCASSLVLAAASSGSVRGAADVETHSAAVEPVSFPERDARLQADLDRELSRPPFRSLVRNRQISVALVDLSRRDARYAAMDDDRMRYAASLPKIAILLGVFDRIVAGDLEYTRPLREKLERMIRRSDNRASSELIALIGFGAIARTLKDPRYALYDPDRNGGLWIGKDYGGPLGYWHRDPLHSISHGATARQVARFFVMLDRGKLISPWASAEMKRILGQPEIRHKFVRGLAGLPRLLIFRKSGSWKQWHADAALVEHDGKRYVAVALVENPSGERVLSSLIGRLDRIAGRVAAPMAAAP